jgi:hypothetical protein
LKQTPVSGYNQTKEQYRRGESVVVVVTLFVPYYFWLYLKINKAFQLI